MKFTKQVLVHYIPCEITVELTEGDVFIEGRSPRSYDGTQQVVVHHLRGENLLEIETTIGEVITELHRLLPQYNHSVMKFLDNNDFTFRSF